PIDAKQAMHVSVLPGVLAGGAQLFANCRVRRVTVRNGRATGVVATVHDPASGAKRGELRVHARAVVLAAGAVFTPALLLRQRLANSSGQVGRNLVIHPAVGTTARFGEDLRAWRGVMQNHHVDELIRDGILLEATFPPPGGSRMSSSPSTRGWPRPAASSPTRWWGGCAPWAVPSSSATTSPRATRARSSAASSWRRASSSRPERRASTRCCQGWPQSTPRTRCGASARDAGGPGTSRCPPTTPWAPAGWAPTPAPPSSTPAGRPTTCPGCGCSTPRRCRPDGGEPAG